MLTKRHKKAHHENFTNGVVKHIFVCIVDSFFYCMYSTCMGKATHSMVYKLRYGTRNSISCSSTQLGTSSATTFFKVIIDGALRWRFNWLLSSFGLLSYFGRILRKFSFLVSLLKRNYLYYKIFRISLNCIYFPNNVHCWGEVLVFHRQFSSFCSYSCKLFLMVTFLK